MKFTKKMRREFEKAINNWGSGIFYSFNDKVMLKAYADDRESLNAILALIDIEDYGGAWRVANLLDTIVRDQIPCSVWNFLSEFDRKHPAE
jgi:hypothetical protein